MNKNSKVPLPSKLLAAVKKEDRARFESNYVEYNYVLEVIREVLLRELEDLQLSEEYEDNFSSPNWETKMAYQIGRRKQLRTILKLFPQREK